MGHTWQPTLLLHACCYVLHVCNTANGANCIIAQLAEAAAASVSQRHSSLTPASHQSPEPRSHRAVSRIHCLSRNRPGCILLCLAQGLFFEISHGKERIKCQTSGRARFELDRKRFALTNECVEVRRHSEDASQMHAITRGQEKLFMLFCVCVYVCVCVYF